MFNALSGTTTHHRRGRYSIGLAILLLLLSAPGRADSNSQAAVTYLDGGPYPIPAILALPQTDARRSSATPVPGVVLLHGTASHKDEAGGLFRRLAEALAAAGIASLRIDFAGTGDSPVDYRQYHLTSAERDAAIAIRYLRDQRSVDPDRVAVLGFSQGGLIAQRAALADSSLAALVLWSTVAADGTAAFRGLFNRHYEVAQRRGFALVDFDWLAEPLAFDLQWFEEIRTQTTRKDMRGFDRPLLAVAGGADRVVPVGQSTELVRTATHARSRAVLLAGANHTFNVLDSDQAAPGQDEALLDVTVGWLAQTLDP